MVHRRSIEVTPTLVERVRAIQQRPALVRLRVSESRLLAIALECGVATLEKVDAANAQNPLDLRPDRPHV